MAIVDFVKQVFHKVVAVIILVVVVVVLAVLILGAGVAGIITASSEKAEETKESLLGIFENWLEDFVLEGMFRLADVGDNKNG